MQNKILIKLLKSFALFLVIFAPCFSFAQDAEISTSQIAKDIEKSMIFDQDARQKIDFYRSDNSKKKSSFTIKSKDFDKEDKTSSVDIVVNNENIGSFDLREKEKLAYNASLIEQYEVAIELYKQILLKEPNNTDIKFALATVYQKLGQFAQAKNLYSQLLKANVENQDAVIGNLLSIITDESPRDAVYLISRLSTENPKSATILASAGNAYDRINDHQHAITMFERAIAIDSSRLEYQYNLALIYDKTSKYEKALTLYSQLVKNAAEDQSIPVDQVKKRIEFIRQKI